MAWTLGDLCLGLTSYNYTFPPEERIKGTLRYP